MVVQTFPAHPVAEQTLLICPQLVSLHAPQVHAGGGLVAPRATSPRSTFNPASKFPNGDMVISNYPSMLLASDPPVPQVLAPQTTRPEPQLPLDIIKQLESLHEADVHAWPEHDAPPQDLAVHTKVVQTLPTQPVVVQERSVQAVVPQARQVHCTLPVRPPMAPRPRSTFNPSSKFPNGDMVISNYPSTLLASDPPVPQTLEPQTAWPEPQLLSTAT